MAIGDNTLPPAYSNRVTLFPPHAQAVTPSDAEVFDGPAAIYVGGDGDVSVVPALPAGAAAVTLTMTAGGFVPFMVRKVNATGTTATNILAVW